MLKIDMNNQLEIVEIDQDLGQDPEADHEVDQEAQHLTEEIAGLDLLLLLKMTKII